MEALRAQGGSIPPRPGPTDLSAATILMNNAVNAHLVQVGSPLA